MSQQEKTSLERRFILPGSGRKPRNCKDYMPIGFCPNCGHVKIVSGNCHSPRCPDCSTYWRYERVEASFKRLYSYKISKKTRLAHTTVSIPKGEVEQLKTIEDINNLRRLVYNYAKSKGMDGGMLIFHPWRLRKDKKQQLRNIANKEDGWMPGDFHLWKTLKKLDNWREYVKFSPHFHIIGACSWLEPGRKEGFIFKRIGDLEHPDDIVKCIMYLLSHVGLSVQHNTKNVHWFGAIARCKWSLSKASKKTQKYTLATLKKVLSNFSKEEDVTYNNCPDCGTEYLDIDLAPHYWTKFNPDVNSLLKYCYKWYSSGVPPPEEELSSKEVFYLETNVS